MQCKLKERNKTEIPAIIIHPVLTCVHTRITTIIADTNKIIYIIDSREADDVTSELKKYPNLKIVSRDGSWTYGKLLLTIIKILAKLQTGFICLKV